jgi:cation diffusion facilitator family transporter
MSNREKLKQGQRMAVIAATVTILLCLMKFTVGWLFESRILITDALHSASDLLTILASWFGLWIASREKSERFPYGLYRAETLASLLVGILIAWAGIETFRNGVSRLSLTEHTAFFPWLPLIASAVSIMAGYVLAVKERAIAREINSQSLRANAEDSFLNAIVSSVVLAGILLAFYRIPYVEGSVIMLISLLIVKLGASTLWTALLMLMDANPDTALQLDMKRSVEHIRGVKEVTTLKIRKSGPFNMVELTIAAAPALSVYKAHALADEVERHIRKHYDHIESVFLHAEPAHSSSVAAIIPVEDINGLQSKVHGHFGRAPYFIILKIHGDRVDIEDFYLNEFLDKEMHIGVKVIKAVIGHGLDVLFTSQIGELSFHMLKDNFVDIYSVQEHMTVQEVIDKYRAGELAQITAPTHGLEESQITKGMKEVRE